LSSEKRLPILRADPFIVALLIASVLGFVAPARGIAATVVDFLKTAAIALLFFLQGVRLERSAVLAGMAHWRLQLLTLACTFLLFPLIGVILRFLVPHLLESSLWLGVLYLCALPSTVQSSIAFTSIARGNVSAAICAATFSNLLGIVLTPLLVALLLNMHASASPLTQITSITEQLLLPFILGQVASRWLRPWASRHPALVAIADRGSIILVVYAAFSAAVVAGTWTRVHWSDVLKLTVLSTGVLALVLALTRLASRLARFNTEDEIATVFCGSKKSLATGVPMANVLFSGAIAGLVILPVMIFHQLQLVICAYLARRYAARPAVPDAALQATITHSSYRADLRSTRR
jgi:solute carrier family 10 (sodium/bile acid cotransporter), member 7